MLYGNPLIERRYATDYAKPTGEMGPVLVVLDHTKLPAGTLNDFQSWNQGTAGGSPTTSAGNLFHALVLRPTGTAGRIHRRLRQRRAEGTDPDRNNRRGRDLSVPRWQCRRTM